MAHRLELEQLLEPAFLEVDGDRLGPALLAQGVPAAPILDIQAVAQSEHARVREMVVRREDYTGPGCPIKLSATPASIRRPAPALGDTAWPAGRGIFRQSIEEDTPCASCPPPLY